jgi:CubicO group peptidase (beta-lactamase class C family)
MLVFLTLAASACGGNDRGARPDPRIDRVLRGLQPALVIAGEPAAHWPLADRMQYYHVPGVSIAVIDSGRIAWTRAVGVKEAGGSDSVNAETVFQAGSISKPTFAVGVMRLVQDHKLDLDRDVNADLESWKVPENAFTVKEKVTLRRLLSHTAGLTVHGFPGYEAGTPVPSVPEILDGKPPANTAPVRVDTIPGAISRYSGGGTTVAMLLVTDVTGRRFPDLMKELVLGPAGMTRSTFEQPLPSAFAPNAATGHSAAGAPVKGKYHTYPEMSAAGLWTTPSDLGALAILLQQTYAGRSSAILAKPTLDQMFTVQPPDTKDGFGIGYHLSGAGPDLEFEHGGADEGFRAEFVAFASRGQGAMIMTNGDNGSELADEVLAAVAAEYGWPSHHPRVKKLVTKDSKSLAELAGTYSLEVGQPKPVPAIVAVDGGKLFLRVDMPQIGTVELLADSDSTFFTRGVGYSVTFDRDRSGRVTAITIDQSIKGKKVVGGR